MSTRIQSETRYKNKDWPKMERSFLKVIIRCVGTTVCIATFNDSDSLSVYCGIINNLGRPDFFVHLDESCLMKKAGCRSKIVEKCAKIC